MQRKSWTPMFSRTGKAFKNLMSSTILRFSSFRLSRYDDEGDDDYNDPIEKRAISGFEHALRIRRSEEADQALRHAIRIRASPYVHALRIKKANSNFNHALRIRGSPYGHALRIKKGGQYSHALRIRSSPYSHALRVRRSGMPEFEEDYFYDYPDAYKRASAYSHVLRVR